MKMDFRSLTPILFMSLIFSGFGPRPKPDPKPSATPTPSVSTRPTSGPSSTPPKPTPVPTPTASVPPQALKMRPDSSTVTTGASINLNVTGGYPPYLFYVRPSDIGSISNTGSFKASNFSGHAYLEVRDSKNTSVSAQIQIERPLSTMPNDAFVANQYAPSITDTTQAWKKNTDCRNVIVGVIDSGTDYNHPDLKDNIWNNPGEGGADEDKNGYTGDFHGWDFAFSDSQPLDENYHGTHVAGIIGAVANNGLGVTGVCWKAQIMVLRFIDQSGSGYTSDAIKAIYYAIGVAKKLKVPVILNNSWAGGSYDKNLKDAIDDAADAGILFVAAAGNETNNNDTSPVYPASYDSPNIISVAATDRYDQLADFSNYGQTSVHIAAPGVSIYSTFPSYLTAPMQERGYATGYRAISGTSMAAPYVSGAAALLWSYSPNRNFQAIKSALLDHSDVLRNLEGSVVGSRRINVNEALLSLQ